jgi:hypothetical protein
MSLWLLAIVLCWPVGAVLSVIYGERVAPRLIPSAEIEAEAQALVLASATAPPPSRLARPTTTSTAASRGRPGGG